MAQQYTHAWDHLLRPRPALPVPDLQSLWEEFAQNGKEVELDAMDLLKLNSKRKLALQEVDPIMDTDSLEFHQMLDYTRNELSKMRPLKGKKGCVFCKNNKETEAVYSTHVLKDALGLVVCPILCKYTCPQCLATGSKAHTIKYCPFNDGLGTVDALLRSPRNCAGKRRLNQHA